MSNYEMQIQAAENYYVPEMRNIEESGNEILASVDPRSDVHMYEWADVLRDLEGYY
jgi:hypothetical protein